MCVKLKLISQSVVALLPAAASTCWVRHISISALCVPSLQMHSPLASLFLHRSTIPTHSPHIHTYARYHRWAPIEHQLHTRNTSSVSGGWGGVLRQGFEPPCGSGSVSRKLSPVKREGRVANPIISLNMKLTPPCLRLHRATGTQS